MHGSVDDERGRIQLRNQVLDELLHPVLERSEQRRGGSVGATRHLLSSGEHGAAEAAVSALHFNEARQDGADAEVGGFAAVYPGEKWVGKAVHHFGAVVALHQ